MINEDYERDFLKDVIYLHEEVHELEKQVLELQQDVREAAKIIVKKEEINETKSIVLPF